MALSLLLAASALALGQARLMAQVPGMSLPPADPIPLPSLAPLPGAAPFAPPNRGFPAVQQVQPLGDKIVYPYGNPNDILLVQGKQPRANEDQEFTFPNELPGKEIFRYRRSTLEWQEGQRQEAKRLGPTKKAFFPETPALSQDKVQPRQFTPSVAVVTPSYVVHDRLLMEQPNFERYGWDLGILGPPLQVGTYFFDLAALPYRVLSRPMDRIDGSAGKYLPGDNVPLMIYPESFSLTGLAGMAGAYATGPFVFKW